MGVTIHYRGKARSLEDIDGLIEELREIREIIVALKWGYRIVDEEVKGPQG